MVFARVHPLHLSWVLGTIGNVSLKAHQQCEALGFLSSKGLSSFIVQAQRSPEKGDDTKPFPTLISDNYPVFLTLTASHVY